MRKGFREVGIVPAETPVIAKVEPGSPAARTGLQPNDKIIAINGQPVYEILGIADYIRSHPEEPLTLTIERGGKKTEVPFEPGNEDRHGLRITQPLMRG
jgi:regulator of sigma E protease